jgi:hypothetical protein
MQQIDCSFAFDGCLGVKIMMDALTEGKISEI